MENISVAVIGYGNLGSSIVKGLVRSQKIDPSNITATRHRPLEGKTTNYLGINVSNDNVAAVKASDIIIIAVKPYRVKSVVEEIAPALDPKKHVLVSVASGVTIADILGFLKTEDLPVFRAMPNIAAAVGESMTCISAHASTKEQSALVQEIFDQSGETLLINEELMDAATVLGACGTAYVLRFIRGMMQGGIQIGFSSHDARKIALQTVKGAAELLISNGKHPEEEIDSVTTPKGCTIAGLNEMEHQGFSSSLIRGIVTSYEDILKSK
ncbi:pyrroline-5-carboxylate reductase (plasmid) [Fulvitalea axinellae]|uniref:Pyrroline-5-carboxylate reductase n=1 Tax=Fulvitalea axinellae TaxID=1182444 RepID=A0AAU9D9U2_9BACT|nr:pyrroline-5-carboxylate reductase [Fulvitalea axinellae]